MDYKRKPMNNINRDRKVFSQTARKTDVRNVFRDNRAFRGGYRL